MSDIERKVKECIGMLKRKGYTIKRKIGEDDTIKKNLINDIIYFITEYLNDYYIEIYEDLLNKDKFETHIQYYLREFPKDYEMVEKFTLQDILEIEDYIYYNYSIKLKEKVEKLITDIKGFIADYLEKNYTGDETNVDFIIDEVLNIAGEKFPELSKLIDYNSTSIKLRKYISDYLHKLRKSSRDKSLILYPGKKSPPIQRSPPKEIPRQRERSPPKEIPRQSPPKENGNEVPHKALCQQEYPELYKRVSKYLENPTKKEENNILIYIWNNFKEDKRKMRKLWVKCHGDKNYGDKVSEEIFKFANKIDKSEIRPFEYVSPSNNNRSSAFDAFMRNFMNRPVNNWSGGMFGGGYSSGYTGGYKNTETGGGRGGGYGGGGLFGVKFTDYTYHQRKTR